MYEQKRKREREREGIEGKNIQRLNLLVSISKKPSRVTMRGSLQFFGFKKRKRRRRR